MKGGIIETWVPKPVDIVVMNPPYVRQESIPEDSKKYYTSNYNIDRKSDLYCYFVLRALKLINQNGVISVISSDKWLETGYGEDLQAFLVNRLTGIYGQRERTFGADVNSIIFVYGSETDNSKKTDFIYLESYSSLSVRNHVVFQRKDLIPGKWFYLRAPKMFMEKIYPKLTHKLGDFAKIKRGFTTGANDFFYMKDVSASYEVDYLSDPKKFEDLGVNAKNEKELNEEGLIYIENEGRERFVLEKSSTLPIIRSIKKHDRPHLMKKPETLCFYISGKKRDCPFTSKYISFGEGKKISVIRGKHRTTITGYNNIQTLKNRTPWFSLRNIVPTNIFLPVLFSTRFLSFYSDEGLLADQVLEYAYPKYLKGSEVKGLALYLNSTLHFLMLELWSPRMGGGALHPNAIIYKTIPMPKIDIVLTCFEHIYFGDRPTLDYKDELLQRDKLELDQALLQGLGFEGEELHSTLETLYKEYTDLVEDRLVKADKGLKSQENMNEQDN